MNNILLLTRSFLAGFQTTIQKNIALDGFIFSVLLIRHCFTFFFMCVFFFRKDFFKRCKSITRYEFFRILLISFINSFCIVLIFFSLSLIPISVFSILEHSLVSLFSVFAGVLFLKEKVTKHIIFGLSLVLFGLYFVLGGGNSFADISFLGFSLIILYAITVSISGVLSTKSLLVIDVDVYLFWMYLTRFIFFLPLPFLFGEEIKSFFDNSMGFFGLLIFIGFLVFLIDFIGSFLSRRVPYIVRQSMNLLIPCFSAFFGMIWFDGWFSPLQFMGLFVILVGSVFIMYSKNQKLKNKL